MKNKKDVLKGAGAVASTALSKAKVAAKTATQTTATVAKALPHKERCAIITAASSAAVIATAGTIFFCGSGKFFRGKRKNPEDKGKNPVPQENNNHPQPDVDDDDVEDNWREGIAIDPAQNT